MTRRTSTTVPEVTGYRRVAKLKNLISRKIIIFDMILSKYLFSDIGDLPENDGKLWDNLTNVHVFWQ